MSLAVAVVVPTYKRPDMLRRCLDALLAQDFDPAAFEIVVADDGADADTARLVETLAQTAPVSLRYLAVTGRHGPAAARNRGWQATEAPLIAFTDDDCVPDPAWLREGLAVFEDEVASVTGRLVMPIPEPPTDYERNEAGLQDRAEFITANCFVRRSALQWIGGFDERFRLAWREDSDLQFRLLKARLRIRRAPRAVVLHPVRPAPWYVSLSQQRKVFYDALLYKKHPGLYRKKIRPRPNWEYYGIVLALLTGLAGLLAAKGWLAVMGLGVWAGLTCRFCRRRLEGTSKAVTHVLAMIVTSALIPPLAVFWRARGALHFRVAYL